MLTKHSHLLDSNIRTTCASVRLRVVSNLLASPFIDVFHSFFLSLLLLSSVSVTHSFFLILSHTHAIFVYSLFSRIFYQSFGAHFLGLRYSESRKIAQTRTPHLHEISLSPNYPSLIDPIFIIYNIYIYNIYIIFII